MLDKCYDSYGYERPESFITTAELRGIKFAPSKTISQKRTELQAFFSEAGQSTGDLIQSPLLMKPIPVPPHDYSKDYLTIEALEDGNIFFVFNSKIKYNLLNSISYSTDGGESWVTQENPYKFLQEATVIVKGGKNGGYSPKIVDGGEDTQEYYYESDDELGNEIIDDVEQDIVDWRGLFGKKGLEGDMLTINVSAGDKVLFKGVAQSFGDISGTTVSKCHFGSDCKVDVYGNIMSLCYEDDFSNKHELLHDCQFDAMFAGTDIVNASDLILPATTLTLRCYEYMFSGCTSLVSTPQLPATEMAARCYQDMFCICPSLKKAPKLPALELDELCYQAMFSGCTSLTEAPQLPAKRLPFGSYVLMFSGCGSLTKAPELPATDLARACYQMIFRACNSLVKPPKLPAKSVPISGYCGMFQECTSLIETPEFPATEMDQECYRYMFRGCTSLTKAKRLNCEKLSVGCYVYMFSGCTSLTVAPELPSTTLAEWCYAHMFEKCTSLTRAPELPAMTLVDACYRTMFGSCSNLTYIKCLVEDLGQSLSSNPFLSWVGNVSPTGTFVKKAGVEWPTGWNGIPVGWTVEEVE